MDQREYARTAPRSKCESSDRAFSTGSVEAHQAAQISAPIRLRPKEMKPQPLAAAMLPAPWACDMSAACVLPSPIHTMDAVLYIPESRGREWCWGNTRLKHSNRGGNANTHKRH